MTKTCPECNGKGTIETIEDKLRLIMVTHLYEDCTVKENIKGNQDFILTLINHTSYNGGTNGDIITDREIDKIRHLGFNIASVGHNYIYLKKIKWVWKVLSILPASPFLFH